MPLSARKGSPPTKRCSRPSSSPTSRAAPCRTQPAGSPSAAVAARATVAHVGRRSTLSSPSQPVRRPVILLSSRLLPPKCLRGANTRPSRLRRRPYLRPRLADGRHLREQSRLQFLSHSGVRGVAHQVALLVRVSTQVVEALLHVDGTAAVEGVGRPLRRADRVLPPRGAQRAPAVILADLHEHFLRPVSRSALRQRLQGPASHRSRR